ncbi:hypothetical protein C8J57DRAFT_1220361 [Mycena rebaudengoi]|nr:hypothetical protein C8J57DRAFT_1220361 [Mycena rebaudengoi]
MPEILHLAVATSCAKSDLWISDLVTYIGTRTIRPPKMGQISVFHVENCIPNTTRGMLSSKGKLSDRRALRRVLIPALLLSFDFSVYKYNHLFSHHPAARCTGYGNYGVRGSPGCAVQINSVGDRRGTDQATRAHPAYSLLSAPARLIPTGIERTQEDVARFKTFAGGLEQFKEAIKLFRKRGNKKAATGRESGEDDGQDSE